MSDAKANEKKPRPGIKDLVAEYGFVAVGVYLSTSVVVGGLAALAIVFGLEVESAGAGAGTAFSIWLVLKASQIPRIAATAVLTPFVAQLLRRRKKDAAEPPHPVQDGILEGPPEPLPEPGEL